MKFKITLPLLALALLTFYAPDTASARDCMGAKMMADHPDYSKITAEQKKAVRTLMTESREAAQNIKDLLYVKDQELIALHKAAYPNADAIGKKATEIVELRKQLREVRKKVGIEIDKILGLEPGTHSFGGCAGMEMGHKGHMRGGKHGGKHGGMHGKGPHMNHGQHMQGKPHQAPPAKDPAPAENQEQGL